jgi:hypothetical protein
VHWCLPARDIILSDDSCITSSVSLRSPAEIKEALRTTLKKVEESLGSDGGNPDGAELKQIVVQRIANLEAAETPGASNTDVNILK